MKKQRLERLRSFWRNRTFLTPWHRDHTIGFAALGAVALFLAFYSITRGEGTPNVLKGRGGPQSALNEAFCRHEWEHIPAQDQCTSCGVLSGPVIREEDRMSEYWPGCEPDISYINCPNGISGCLVPHRESEWRMRFTDPDFTISIESPKTSRTKPLPPPSGINVNTDPCRCVYLSLDRNPPGELVFKCDPCKALTPLVPIPESKPVDYTPEDVHCECVYLLKGQPQGVEPIKTLIQTCKMCLENEILNVISNMAQSKGTRKR